MVTPAVKREAVAHLKDVHEMSERRACSVIDCDRMTVAIARGARTMPVCANGWWHSPGSAAGSAIAACSSFYVGRASS